MNYFLPAARLFAVMTVITGVAYPLLITGIAKVTMSHQASGSYIEKNGVVIGSEWIGQKFENSRYFSSRPSAVDYNPQPSGGSNLGQASLDLQKTVLERKEKHLANNPSEANPNKEVPQDLIFASASGLDPHISPEAAAFQIARVAKERGLEISAVRKQVERLTEARQFGILGEPRINVLKLNLSLDEL